jgi:hypothetical protein
METRAVMNKDQAETLMAYLQALPMPFTVTVTPGAIRTCPQNRLQRLWVNEIAAQREDMTPEDVRALCKLTIGVPILRAENEAFAAAYDKTVKPLPYETKLAIMKEPLDMPITRLMTKKQKVKYLDGMHLYWSQQGIILTDPAR